MATADRPHTERHAPAAAADGHGAHAAPAGHGHDHSHGHGHGHGHAAHDPAEIAGDKRAAYIGLVGGMVLLGALVYAMVLWTNAQFAGHAGGERAAATSTH